MRPSGRAPDQLRPVSLEPGFSRHAEGSCLVKFGDTHVLCTASVDERVPPWMRNSGRGWVTAEYGMLPRSTHTRTDREAARGKQSGRTQEIQRLIGRSLRAVVDLPAMGERQINIDCDVLQADGGTRTASHHRILGGAALRLRAPDQGRQAHRQPDHRAGRRRLLRPVGRHAGARSRLSGRLQGAGRRQFRADRLGRHRRGAGHGRGKALQRARVHGAAHACQERHRRADAPAAAGHRQSRNGAPLRLPQAGRGHPQPRQGGRDPHASLSLRRRHRLGGRARPAARPRRPARPSRTTPR